MVNSAARALARCLKPRRAPSSRIAKASWAMPSTSPTSRRKPVSSCTLTSDKPPTLEETTGTPAAMASRATRPKLSVSEGNNSRSEMSNGSMGFFTFPRTPHPGPSPTPGSVLCAATVWPVTHHEQGDFPIGAHAGEGVDGIQHPFHRTEIADMAEDGGARARIANEIRGRGDAQNGLDTRSC